MAQAVSLMLSDRAHQIITANSLLILEAQKSNDLQAACAASSLILADSIGLSWAARRLQGADPTIIPGIDFAIELCGMAEILSLPVYLLGGKPGVAKGAARALSSRFPTLSVAGMRDGFFKTEDEEAIIADMTQSKARLFLLALGMPKQELWIHKNKHRLPPGVYMGVGGTFDVWAGRLKRAPLWLRKRGLEWLFRFGQEPHRFRRMAQLPKFALKILSHRN